jgi:hypothetical protein
MALIFRYRYVNFGTAFTSDPRPRESENALKVPATLFANELATDVGGTCLGSNEPLAILDHHFSGEGQFPSASAAVLHKARLIRDRFAQSAGDLLWLVTHQEPDFDAFCSLYLARWILEAGDALVDWQDYGLHPEGWLNLPDRPEIQKIDWFNPDLSRVPPEHRWALLLASYASTLDGRQRISCLRQRALHSILAAAMKRGRNYLSDTSGATEFFDEVRTALLERHLNPVFDSVLESSARFAPELAMLDREAEAYERDLCRARKSTVYLPQAEAPSASFFKNPKQVARLKLEGKSHEVNAEELLLADTFRIPTDGIYLRDPECAIFQEWARVDVEHSALASGFEFTAVAYSNGCPSDALNQSDYIFSLDPERANGRHLYTVWSRLQTKRMEALQTPQRVPRQQVLPPQNAQNPGVPGTPGLGTPAGAQLQPGASQAGVAAPEAQPSTKAGRLVTDPWFGGPNSNGMLVRTPSHGTAIAPAGTRHDLRDDPVAEEVRTELELAIYAAQSLATGPQVRVVDLAGAEDCEDRDPRSWELNAAREIPPPPEGYFRFAAVRLRADVAISAGNGEGHSLAAQIGDTLWQVLYPEQPGALPENFVQRHVIVTAEGVAVWSLRGIAMAQKSAPFSAAPSPAHHRTLGDDFAKVVSLVRDIQQFTAACDQVMEAGPQISSKRAGANPHQASADANAALVEGKDLARRAAQVELVLAMPEREILRRLADAIGMDQLLAALRDLNQAAAENLQRRELAVKTRRREEHGDVIAKLRSRLEWLEVFILAFLAPQIAQAVVRLYGGEDSMGRAAALLSGPVVAGLMAWVLRPWKRKSETDDGSLRTSSVVLAVLIAACIAAWAADLLRIWAK